MSVLETLRARAAQLKRSIVLPESEDPCVIEAALILAKEGIAKPILVGNPDTIRSLAADNDLALPAGLMMPDPQRDADLTARIDRLYEIRKGAGVSREQAAAL